MTDSKRDVAELVPHLVDDEVHVLLDLALEVERRLEVDRLDADAADHGEALGAHVGRGAVVVELEPLDGLEHLGQVDHDLGGGGCRSRGCRGGRRST